MFMRALILAMLVAVVAAMYPEKVEVASNTTCVCTTVPCPVSGSNTLVEGELF